MSSSWIRAGTRSWPDGSLCFGRLRCRGVGVAVERGVGRARPCKAAAWPYLAWLWLLARLSFAGAGRMGPDAPSDELVWCSRLLVWLSGVLPRALEWRRLLAVLGADTRPTPPGLRIRPRRGPSYAPRTGSPHL